MAGINPKLEQLFSAYSSTSPSMASSHQPGIIGGESVHATCSKPPTTTSSSTTKLSSTMTSNAPISLSELFSSASSSSTMQPQSQQQQQRCLPNNMTEMKTNNVEHSMSSKNLPSSDTSPSSSSLLSSKLSSLMMMNNSSNNNNNCLFNINEDVNNINEEEDNILKKLSNLNVRNEDGKKVNTMNNIDWYRTFFINNNVNNVNENNGDNHKFKRLFTTSANNTLESIENSLLLNHNVNVDQSSYNHCKISSSSSSGMNSSLTNDILGNKSPTKPIMVNLDSNCETMSNCLKSFLFLQQRNETDAEQVKMFGCGVVDNNDEHVQNISKAVSGGVGQDNICSSLSSSSTAADSDPSAPSSSSSTTSEIIGQQFSPPSNMMMMMDNLDLIGNETLAKSLEHTEDFIKSLLIPLDVLDDLASRFVLNMPDEEKSDPIRICFQMENAYWHYLDFHCECNSKLPKFKFKKFAQIMFTYVPRLRQFLDVFDNIIQNWIQYKFSIPCSGAIMLDETMEHVLLVQGFGSKTWGFPKGKVNHDESLMNCAIREVFEETGYNCMDNICENHYLERKIFESRLRLYLIKNVDFNFDFQPQARNEIRSIKWFALKDFPQHDQRKVMMAAQGNGNVLMPHNASKFVSVMPFIFAIRRWVENDRRREKIQKKRERRQLARQQRKLQRQQQTQQLEQQRPTQRSSGGGMLEDDAIISMGQANIMLNESNSSSPSTVADDDDAMSTTTSRIVMELLSDSELQQQHKFGTSMNDSLSKDISNQSTNFVEVDLKDILGVKEMYHVKNDQRKGLMTREELNMETNQKTLSGQQQMLLEKQFESAIWNKLMPRQPQNSREPTPTKNQALAARTLEDIERSMMNEVNNKTPTKSATPTTTLDVLASKGGDCKEKLNLLFGLAGNNNNKQTMISQSTSPISNTTKQQDPIGTKRQQTIIMTNNNNSQNHNPLSSTPLTCKAKQRQQDNHYHQKQKTSNHHQRSGQTVISTSETEMTVKPCLNGAGDIGGLMVNNNDNLKQMVNDDDNVSSQKFLNGLFEQFKMQQQPKSEMKPEPGPSTTKNPIEIYSKLSDIEGPQKMNGLKMETKNMVQPKVDLLLQRLLAINNSA